jgi:phage head maturation protease
MANNVTRTETRDMPALEFRAQFVPGTIDEERRTVQIVWTTGARVLRGFFDQYYEELSLDPKHVRMNRLNGGAPLLDSHNSDSLRSVIGVVESATLEKKRGVAMVRFDSGAEAAEVWRKVREGIVRNVSVGYRVYKMVRVQEEEGKTPIMRAEDWEPYELSMVPIGADAGATTRSGQSTNQCEFEETIMAQDTNETPAGAQPGKTERAALPAVSFVDIEQVRAAERERIAGIQRVGSALERSADEIEKAIANGTSLSDYRAAAQDDFAKRKHIAIERNPHIVAGEAQRDKWLRGAESWLLIRSGLGKAAREAAKQTGWQIDENPGEFRGASLSELARQCLENSGVRTRGMTPQEIVGAALSQRSNSGYAATGDFPILLENITNKSLLTGYIVTPDSWSRFCKQGTLADFKPHGRYRQGSFGALSKVGENGEFKSKAIPDGQKESLTADTRGDIIGITRKTIVNDDLGVFTDLGMQLGRAAKLSVEVDVYALLALNGGLGPNMRDGNPLFHASRGNITTGAALSAAALDLDRVAMGVQKDPSGNEIYDLSPTILVISKSLGGQARTINDSPFDPDNIANKAQNRINVAAKMFTDIVDTARITGNRRYLFADPMAAPVIEVAFLYGKNEPTMEMKEGWRVDGAEWRIYIDYAVGAIDAVGAITNAGA